MNTDRFNQEHLFNLGNELAMLLQLPSTYERNYNIGVLIRKQLDKAYRKGFTDGCREGKNK